MKPVKHGLVCIVHHVDTEGPLREPVAASFERLEGLFGTRVSAPATLETLRQIQRQELDEIPGQIRSEVAAVFADHLLQYKTDWRAIEEMLTRIRHRSFRLRRPDSYGGGWIFNWHILDHAGFVTNQRSRDLGYLSVFNRYEEILSGTERSDDEVHWHFHPIPFGRDAHASATSYDNSYHELHQILSRRLIEKEWFPRVNRAGFHTIRPDSNLFLEQWIPFDASNQSVEENQTSQADARNGRFGDWRGAPDDWSLYHPDPRDWRKPGEMQRVIARCLNLDTRFRNISEAEIDKAFARAAHGETVYLGITNHDFREMSVEIEGFHVLLDRVASKWPRVRFRYCGAVDAFRRALGYSPSQVASDAIRLEASLEGNLLRLIVVRGECFGPQPYLALKTRDGRYLHDNLDFGEAAGEFLYTFDWQTIPLESLAVIAAASNDRYGNCHIATINLAGGLA